MGKKIVVVENSILATYTIRKALMLKLKDAGNEVYVLTSMNEYAHLAREMGIELIDVGTSGQDPRGIIAYIRRIRKAIKSIRPDVCLTFTIRPAIYGNLVTRWLKVPTITNITGIGPLFASKSFLYRIARILYKFVLRSTKKIFFQNMDDMNLFLEHNFAKPSVVERIPGSGVEYDYYAPREKVNAPDGTFRFLYIGRLLKDKGVLEYIGAARMIKATHPQAICQVLGPLWLQNLKGNTITQTDLDGWIAEGIIEYLGETGDVRPFMAEADCLVLPSYREGTSNVLLEAASMALPCITTNTTGCREIVEDGVTGYLCEVQDTEGLAAKMTQMLHQPESERKAMGRKGREKVIREYDKQIVINAYLKAIDTVTKGN
jgi:glycosyltransferase involved in cell wall biosynthesis